MVNVVGQFQSFANFPVMRVRRQRNRQLVASVHYRYRNSTIWNSPFKAELVRSCRWEAIDLPQIPETRTFQKATAIPRF